MANKCCGKWKKKGKYCKKCPILLAKYDTLSNKKVKKAEKGNDTDKPKKLKKKHKKKKKK